MNIALIILILILSIVAYHLFLTFGRKSLSAPDPGRPKLEVPVTYNIGWWSHQEMLSIDSLDIEIIECKLNLFNSKSIISYKVSGLLNYDGYWQPQIEKVHISERLNSDTTLHYDRIIEITPIIQVKRDDRDGNGSLEKFEFKNEHIITSGQWGINRIKFVCGLKEQIIEFRQGK